jgi:hypothetical protein
MPARSKSKPAQWRVECAEVETVEIRPLTEKAVDELLTGRDNEYQSSPHGRRRAIRWPFPGTVELWISEENGGERYTLATSQNLGRHGIGLCCDEDLPIGTSLQIAIHEPEMSFHGRAVVRHSTPADDGSFVLGLQFLFDPA